MYPMNNFGKLTGRGGGPNRRKKLTTDISENRGTDWIISADFASFKSQDQSQQDQSDAPTLWGLCPS